MLPASHNQAYQELLTSLLEFKTWLNSLELKAHLEVNQKFSDLCQWFEQNIIVLEQEDVGGAIAPRWQSLQTEIKREFKLLSTDMLFLVAARQSKTRNQRLNSVVQHLDRLIGYCQIMLDN